MRTLIFVTLPLALFAGAFAWYLAQPSPDPLPGCWTIDIEQTLASVAAVPERRKAKYASLEDYKAALREELAGTSLIISLGQDQLLFNGVLERHRKGSTRGSDWNWKRIHEGDGKYEVWRWVSGWMWVKDGELSLNGARLVWSFADSLDRRGDQSLTFIRP